MIFNKIRLNLIFWILLFLLFYSNYTTNSFVYDNRIFFSVIFILSIIFRFFRLKNKVLVLDIPSKILIFSYSVLAFLDLAKGLYASALGSLMLVLIILIINSYNFKEIFNQIVNLNRFNNFLSLIFLITPIIYFDSNTARNVLGLPVPYFLSYTSQASLIPALLMLPLAIYFLFYVKYHKFNFLLLTIAISFGGNVYTSIVAACIFYFIINKFSKFIFIATPFFLMIIFTVSLYTIGSSFFDKTAELRAQVRIAKANNDSNTLDWKMERTISGTERLAFYYDQIKSFKVNLFWGSSSSNDFQSLGSLILKFGIRGGILILFTMSYFLAYLLNELYKFNNEFANKKLGVVLLYSLIIQAVVYNEMGFYSHYALVLLFIVYKLLKAKNTELQSNEVDLVSIQSSDNQNIIQIL